MKTNSNKQTPDLARGFVVAGVFALVGFAALALGNASGQEPYDPEVGYQYRPETDDESSEAREEREDEALRPASQDEKPSTIVTTAKDVVKKTDRKISLREAIAYAKDGDAIAFDMDALNGQTTFVIDPKLGELVVDKSITIDASNLGEGSSDGLTLDGKWKTRILRLNSQKKLEIRGVTFTRGAALGKKPNGGAVYSSGALTLCDCDLTECRAEGEGGAIYGSDQIRLIRCNLTGNRAYGSGGGLCARGARAQLDQCAIENNESRKNGGGIYFDGGSGTFKECRVKDCQFLNNAGYFAGGGICLVNKSKASLSSCELLENTALDKEEGKGVGGGIYVGANSELDSLFCKISENTADYADADDVYVFASSDESRPGGFARAYNTTSSFAGWAEGSGNQNAFGELFDSVANSDGKARPQKPNRPNDPSSSSRRGGAPGGFGGTPPAPTGRQNDGVAGTSAPRPSYDRNRPPIGGSQLPPPGGFLAERPQSEDYLGQNADDQGEDAPDLAEDSDDAQSYLASEEKTPQVIVVTTAKDLVDNLGGDTSLRKALTEAKDGDTIVFAPTLEGQKIWLNSTRGELVVDKAITIDASSSRGIVLSGQNNSRVLNVNYEGNDEVKLMGLGIADGYSKEDGGGVYVTKGRTRFVNCSIKKNRAKGVGGGIYLAPGAELAMINCAITFNSTSQGGGGVFIANDSQTTDAASAVLTLQNCTVAKNTSDFFGGGLHLQGGKVECYNSIVCLNQAKRSGNDVYVNAQKGVVAEAHNTLSSFTAWKEGEANLSYDSQKKLFENADTENFHLAENSQAIDQGDSDRVDYRELEEDLAGEKRIVGDAVDLGAYEFQVSPTDELDAQSDEELKNKSE